MLVTPMSQSSASQTSTIVRRFQTSSGEINPKLTHLRFDRNLKKKKKAKYASQMAAYSVYSALL